MIGPGIPNPLLFPGGDPLDELGKIDYGLRLRRQSSAHLTLSPPAPATTQRITFSLWCRRTALDAVNQIIFGGGEVGTGYAGDYFGFNATHNFFIAFDDSTNALGPFATATRYQDPSAWMHIVLAFDTTQANAADRMTLEINGTAVALSHALGQNAALYFMHSAGSVPAIGVRNGTSNIDNPAGISIAHFACVAGQKLPASSFGKTHPRTGQWRPKSRSEIIAVVNAGGQNSFFLAFDNPSSLGTLCADASAKGNNWTPANISIAADKTNDALIDSPTNTFATLNPLIPYSSLPTFRDGNLGFDCSVSAYPTVFGTQGMTSGKWYWEVTPESGNIIIGLGNRATSPNNYIGGDPNGWSYHPSGQKYNSNAVAAYGAAFTTGDVISVLFDADAGTLAFRKNGTDQGVAFTGLTAGPYFPAAADGSSVSSESATFNFGQRPFAYAIPGGYKSLCTKNLTYRNLGDTVASSGTFTGSASVDGPCININGTPDTLTINGNAVTFGTHADRLATGFKIRSSAAAYNSGGSNSWIATTLASAIKSLFRFQNAKGN